MNAEINRNAKAALITALIIVLYLVFLYAGKAVLEPEEQFRHHMMNFTTPETGISNIFAIALALAGGAIVFLALREEELQKKAKVTDECVEVMKKAMAEISRGARKDTELEVIKKALAELLKERMAREILPEQKREIIKAALTSEEKKMLAEIEKAGEITQDSLRFRLGWSKAKASAIASNLDRMGVVQRERVGKTYRVFLEKKQ